MSCLSCGVELPARKKYCSWKCKDAFYMQDGDKRLAKNERMKRYRVRNAEKIKNRRKNAYWNNTNGLRDKMKGYYEANKERLIPIAVENRKQTKYNERNKDKLREYSRSRSRKAIESLSDSYIITLIKRNCNYRKNGKTMSVSQIRSVPGLIEGYRSLVQLKRLCQKK